MSKRTKESRKRVNSLILLIAFTAILLIASTYAWFSTQKNVAINNLKGRVEVAEGLQISWDADAWAQELVLGQETRSGDLETALTADWTDYDKGISTATGFTSHNYRPRSIYTPDGGTTHTDTNTTDASTGYMEVFSGDGVWVYGTGKNTIIPLYGGTYSGTKLSASQEYNESTAAVDKHNGYYAFDVYIMDTSKPDATGDTKLQLGYTSKVEEILASATATDYGLKNCVRVGFGAFDSTADYSKNQEEALTLTEAATNYISQVAIWEPNCNAHSDYVMKQNKVLNELVGGNSSTILNTYAIKTGLTDGSAIANVYDSTDTTKLGSTEKYINQTVAEIVKGQANAQVAAGNKTGNIYLKNTTCDGTLDADTEYFSLKRNKITKVRVYIWLEGQDPDCVNWASHSSGIDVDINLAKDQKVGSEEEVAVVDITDTEVQAASYATDHKIKSKYVLN